MNAPEKQDEEPTRELAGTQQATQGSGQRPSGEESPRKRKREDRHRERSDKSPRHGHTSQLQTSSRVQTGTPADPVEVDEQPDGGQRQDQRCVSRTQDSEQQGCELPRGGVNEPQVARDNVGVTPNETSVLHVASSHVHNIASASPQGVENSCTSDTPVAVTGQSPQREGVAPLYSTEYAVRALVSPPRVTR